MAGRREIVVTKTRKAVGSVQILKCASDVLYPRAGRVVLGYGTSARFDGYLKKQAAILKSASKTQ